MPSRLLVAARRPRAEKLPVAADMPDRVDARRAVLAAEMLHLAVNESAAVAEGAACWRALAEDKRIERIHRCDGE